MAAAIALAIVLVIAVAGISLAMQTQHPVPGQPTPPPRPPRPQRTPPVPPRRVRDRSTPPPPAADPVLPPIPAAADGQKVPELLRNGVSTSAKVVNVVDERVVGSVTRSRLTLQIQPAGGPPFEVSIRHTFSTADARGQVRVGGTVAVRYDRDDHHRVILDPHAGDDGRG